MENLMSFIFFFPCQHLEFRKHMKVDTIISEWRPPEVEQANKTLLFRQNVILLTTESTLFTMTAVYR